MFWELLPFSLYFVSWIMSLVIAVRGLSRIQNFSWDSNNLLVKVKSESEVAGSCPTLCNPIDGSPQTSLSLRFSRQEHWSGLPFPSPMHESERWKWSRSVVPDPQWPHGLQPSRLSTEELMFLNCGVGEDSWESLGLQGDPTSPFWRRSVLGFLWKEWC